MIVVDRVRLVVMLASHIVVDARVSEARLEPLLQWALAEVATLRLSQDFRSWVDVSLSIRIERALGDSSNPWGSA